MAQSGEKFQQPLPRRAFCCLSRSSCRRRFSSPLTDRNIRRICQMGMPGTRILLTWTTTRRSSARRRRALGMQALGRRTSTKGTGMGAIRGAGRGNSPHRTPSPAMPSEPTSRSLAISLPWARRGRTAPRQVAVRFMSFTGTRTGMTSGGRWQNSLFPAWGRMPTWEHRWTSAAPFLSRAHPMMTWIALMAEQRIFSYRTEPSRTGTSSKVYFPTTCRAATTLARGCHFPGTP